MAITGDWIKFSLLSQKMKIFISWNLVVIIIIEDCNTDSKVILTIRISDSDKIKVNNLSN